MDNYSVTDARTRLSELVARAEQGETIGITRHGKFVAYLAPPSKSLSAVDVDALHRLASRLPVQRQGAGDFIRAMRDSDRY